MLRRNHTALISGWAGSLRATCRGWTPVSEERCLGKLQHAALARAAAGLGDKVLGFLKNSLK